MNKPGYFLGLALVLGAAWLFLDSVRVVSGGVGWFTRGMYGWGPSSHVVVFLPFLAGIVGLFYSGGARWAKVLTGLGLLVVIVEIVSGIHWWFHLKATHFLLLLVMLGAGFGFLLRSKRD